MLKCQGKAWSINPLHQLIWLKSPPPHEKEVEYTLHLSTAYDDDPKSDSPSLDEKWHPFENVL